MASNVRSAMAISGKTRKLLWGRSGSLCALCKQKLIYDATSEDDEAVVGDECHIISSKENGPRYDRDFPPSQTDSPSNLIVLCKTHHKLVDDQPDTFTASILGQLRTNHEKWVAERLSDTGDDASEDPPYLSRVFTGQQLLRVVAGAYQFAFSNDELKDQQDVRLASAFMQELQDYGDIWNELDAGMRVSAEYELSESMKEIEAVGFWVFAARKDRSATLIGQKFESWPTAYVRLTRNSSPSIIALEGK